MSSLLKMSVLMGENPYPLCHSHRERDGAKVHDIVQPMVPIDKMIDRSMGEGYVEDKWKTINYHRVAHDSF